MSKSFKTIDNYLNLHKTSSDKRKIFYLNWRDKDQPYYQQATFVDSISGKLDFCKNIKWRGFGTLTICGNFKPYNPYKFSKGISEVTNVPLLKSHLQKCIRRNLTGKAIRTAYVLMEKDMTHFLRRMPIVIAEDAFLHLSFPTLIWMMAAQSSGWKLGRKHIEWLLGVVHLTAEHQYWEVSGFCEDTEYSIDQNLQEPFKSFLLSLQLRKSYGGMGNDMRMLNYLTSIWNDRFLDEFKISLINGKVKCIDPDSVAPLAKDDIDLSAVDFNCFPWMIRSVKEAFPEYSEEQLKRTIWRKRSGVNLKDMYPYGKVKKEHDLNEVTKIWQEIEPEVTRLAQYARKRYI